MIVGVHIVCDGSRRRVVERDEIGNDARERGAGLRGIQIADMLADEDLLPHTQRDGILQMRSHRENRGHFLLQHHRQRGVTPRAA